MGLCTCTPTCACAIHAKSAADGGTELLTITGNGNTDSGGWELDVKETLFAAVNDDGCLDIAVGGAYGHAPHFNMKLAQSETIGLQATADGIRADLISAPAGAGGLPPGVPMNYLGDVAPAGFVMASGPNYAGFVSIANHGGLFGVIGHSANGGVDPGDGTFKVPYLGDRFLVGQGSWGGVGTMGGLAAVTLALAELPSHGHGVSDPTHDHPATTTITSGGGHTHDAGAAGERSFVTTDTETPQTAAISTAGSDDIIVEVGLEATPRQTNNQATAPGGTHTHPASTAVTMAATGVTVLNNGGGGAHENRPPFYVTNVIISG